MRNGFRMAAHAGALTVAMAAYLLAKRYAGEWQFTLLVAVAVWYL